MRLILRYNLRNLFVRRVSNGMTILGVGMVVAVFIVMMALANGIKSVAEASGDPLQAMVLQKNANAETTSGISDETADQVESLPETPKDAKGPLVSRDLFVVLNLARKDPTQFANVTARGVTPRAFDLRPFVKVDGDARPQGSNIIVARALSTRFANMQPGDKLRFGRRDWTVVGLFDGGGSIYESEIWVDIRELGVDFKRENACSSMSVRMSRPEDIQALNMALEKSKDLKGLKAMSQPAYFEAQKAAAVPIQIVGMFITVMLSAGAGLGAMNTMYAAIGYRAREIGTLRALGFGRFTILVAFVAESAMIGFLGGLVGVLFALPVHGLTTGTLNWISFAETAFQFRVTPTLMLVGLFIGTAVGAVGGFLPAWFAARRPIIQALRAA